ncbi:COX15/CtaA family [Globomyces pollinis-pini]|nr:COX15/CtaA family [Globomyces pollinis-pini]
MHSNTRIPFVLQFIRSIQNGMFSLHQKAYSTEPETPISRPVVAYWYLFCAALVFGIVILGGVTRLTESGLSIVEWNVIKGMKPPLNEHEWELEFEKYKLFPEYQLLNHNITIDEFKRIFYFEWAHRMLGRFIGLSFVLPGLYLAKKGYLTKSIKSRSLVVATMIGIQGLFGWYMVKSGLSDDIVKNKDVPRVNHFWLSLHLGSAFVIYSTMLFTGLQILKENRLRLNPPKNAFISNPRFKIAAHIIATLIFVTAISGAWVAGLDAGLIYNEFPYMGTGLVPSDMWAYSTESKQNPEPMSAFQNLIRNPSAVQFSHRLLAMTTFTAITGLWIFSRKTRLSRTSKLVTNLMMGVALCQVTLGISTLIYLVPVPLAAAHQGGSLTLLSMAIWLMHTLKRLPK